MKITRLPELSSMDLDDIWDAPVSPARAVTPHKRPIETLFLSGSDNEDEQPAPKRPASSAPRPDVDALFADIDKDEDEEDDLRYKPLAPALDLEALHKQAAAKHVLTPHQILPSSSPPRDVGLDEDDEGGDKKGKGKEGKKERKKVATLDEASLVGATGFPQLITNIKDFKVKGKGHEVSFTDNGHGALMAGSLCSFPTFIGFSRCTSFGLIDCFPKLRSRTLLNALKNYVTQNECRCDHI
jgi:replication fork protection complex subunit Csm3/Swi3